jgi:hypothetical protein
MSWMMTSGVGKTRILRDPGKTRLAEYAAAARPSLRDLPTPLAVRWSARGKRISADDHADKPEGVAPQAWTTPTDSHRQLPMAARADGLIGHDDTLP